MKGLYRIISKLYDRQIDSIGLAVFRIAFAVNLLVEVARIFHFRHLIYDKIPYIEVSEVSSTVPLAIWMLALVLIIFGAFTRFATVLNYLMALVCIGSIRSYEYHMFYTYMGVSFLMMLIPLERSFSIDRLLRKIKYSNTRTLYAPPQKVSVLAYYAFILLGIAFVYFDSTFYKLCSDIWMNGLGMWLPASLPQFTISDASWLMNIPWLAMSLGYLTLIFEAVFIFLFWRSKFRVSLLVVGLGLHLGILLFYPIPQFALGVMAIYLLMVPVGFWRRIFKRNQNQVSNQIYYDAECPLCVRTKLVIEHLDWFGRNEFKTVQENAKEQPQFDDLKYDVLLDDLYSVDRKGQVSKGIDTYIKTLGAIIYLVPLSWVLRVPGVYHLAKKMYNYVASNRYTERCTEENCGYDPPSVPTDLDPIRISQKYTFRDLRIAAITAIFMICLILQFNVTFHSLLIQNTFKKLHIENTFPIKIANKLTGLTIAPSRLFLGITPHAVFMDNHLDGYHHIIAIQTAHEKKTLLPIADKGGHPLSYQVNFNWVKWAFRVNGPVVDMEQLEKGIRDFTVFWARKNQVKMDSLDLEIMVKKIQVPEKWEKDFLHRQESMPWHRAGEVHWRGNVFTSNLINIEEI